MNVLRQVTVQYIHRKSSYRLINEIRRMRTEYNVAGDAQTPHMLRQSAAISALVL